VSLVGKADIGGEPGEAWLALRKALERQPDA